MRILLVNKYWRRQGGVEEYCFMLKRTLEDRGHEVVPFSQLESTTLETPWRDYFVPEVDPTRPSPRAMRRVVLGDETTRAVRRLLDEVHIDAAHVVHTYHQLGPMFMKELAARDVPTLLSVHDYKLCCPSYRLLDDSTHRICTRCLDNPRQRVVAPVLTGCWKGSRAAGAMLGAEAAMVRLRKPYHTARRVLVSNDLMRRCVVSAGINEDRVRIVPNYWPAAEPRVDVPDAPFLFVGRLVTEKGVDTLINASADSGIPVRIVGDGPLRDELEDLARRTGAPVEFLGPLWGDAAEAEMRRARALVVPSVWHEVSPLVVYQAMSLGVPVIGTDVGGMPDLLGDGRGWLVPPGDAPRLAITLKEVAGDARQATEVARRALDHSRTQLSRERFEQRLENVYAEAGVVL